MAKRKSLTEQIKTFQAKRTQIENELKALQEKQKQDVVELFSKAIIKARIHELSEPQIQTLIRELLARAKTLKITYDTRATSESHS